jgi:glutathione synthase/RimK-type ligase-like ATP-grasp enzyme
MFDIGILGQRNDPQVSALQKALEQRGAKAHVIDFQPFPKYNIASMNGVWSFDDIRHFGSLDLMQLKVIHLRKAYFDTPDAQRVVRASRSEMIAQVSEQMAKISFQINFAQAIARHTPVINPAHSFVYHRQKALQHQLLLRNGIPTPSALITSDMISARAFVQAMNGQVVAKPQASGAEVVLADHDFWQQCGNSQNIRPYMFQQFVRGRSFRLYALGGRIVSMGEIEYDRRYIDWRERTQSVKLLSPDATIAAQVAKATRLLDMPICGIDLEYDNRTQQTYFLDFNPSALFVGWSRMTGFDMADSIACYLLQIAKNGGKIWF